MSILSLRSFHLFFVAASVALSAVVGVWGVRSWRTTGSGSDLAFGIFFFVAGFMLASPATAQVAPTLRIGRQLLARRVVPSARAIDRYLADHGPMPVRWLRGVSVMVSQARMLPSEFVPVCSW